MVAIRCLITSACLFSWDWKPAMSRIVFWFRYVLNCCWNRGRSSSVNRRCSSRYPSAASTAASSSSVSTGYAARNSPISETILLPMAVRRVDRRSMSVLTCSPAALDALSQASAVDGGAFVACASRLAIASK
jgi:hypothetical protein